jgi:D-alanine-D-alanine ligase
MRSYVVLWNRDENVRGGQELDALAATSTEDVIEPLRAALAKLGPVEIVETGDGDPEALARALKAKDPRVVFNLAEAARGVPELEPCVAGVLELLGIPYTGNTPQTLALCLDKGKTKLLLTGAGIPVPRGVVLRDAAGDPMLGLEYPVIVKPAAMDASHGIEPSNVVWDEAAARSKAAELITRFPPAALVERFIDGRDLLVALLQVGAGAPPTVLPLGEIDFQLPPGVPRVSGFQSKWVTSSEAFERTPGVYPARVSAALARRIREVAVAAFVAVGGRDYARIDVRVDADDRPFVLEVNPNPCLNPYTGLGRASAVAGWSYDELVHRIVRNAEERGALAPLPRRG